MGTLAILLGAALLQATPPVASNLRYEVIWTQNVHQGTSFRGWAQIADHVTGNVRFCSVTFVGGSATPTTPPGLSTNCVKLTYVSNAQPPAGTSYSFGVTGEYGTGSTSTPPYTGGWWIVDQGTGKASFCYGVTSYTLACFPNGGM